MAVFSYSRAYRRNLIILVTCLFLSVCCSIYIVCSREPLYIFFLVLIPFFAGFAYLVDRLCFVVEITDNTFRYRTIFFDATYKIEELRGFDYRKGVLTIYPMNRRNVTRVPQYCSKPLYDWITTNLKNINDVRKAACIQQLQLQHPGMDVVKTAKAVWDKQAWWLHGGSVVISILTVALSFLFDWVPLIIFSWELAMLYILWKSDGWFSIYFNKADPRPAFAGPLMLPTVVLFFFNNNIELVDPWLFYKIAIFGATILLLVLLLINRKREITWSWHFLYILPFYFVAFGICVYQSLGYLNIALPQRSSEHNTVVLDKWIVDHNKGSIHYVKLDRWLPSGSNDETTQAVFEKEYDTIQIGHPLSIEYHTGGLGVAWYKFDITRPPVTSSATP